MKKWIFWLVLLTLALTACGGKAVDEEPVPDWGITLTAENVTGGGLTLRCTQSGGQAEGELSTGSWYELHRRSGGNWVRVEYDGPENVGWDDVAWLIPMEGSASWEVDWQWLYGSLAPGEYRIAKEIMNFHGPGDYSTAIFYAEFHIA